MADDDDKNKDKKPSSDASGVVKVVETDAQTDAPKPDTGDAGSSGEARADASGSIETAEARSEYPKSEPAKPEPAKADVAVPARWSGPRPKLILVTDPAYKDDRIVEAAEACAKALPPGMFCVQLRDKRKDPGQLRAFAERLRAATKPHGALLLINGNPELAKAVGADGVHLGGSKLKVPDARRVFGPGALVTIAAHSDDAVRYGLEDGAEGALVSSIFAVPGKAIGRGLDALKSARKVAPPAFSIYALGGIDRTNAADCAKSGADGIAAIRALLLAPDPGAEARAIFENLTASA